MMQGTIQKLLLFVLILSSCGPVTPYPSRDINPINQKIAVPAESEVISSDNLGRLSDLVQLGKGSVGGTDISPDGRQIAVYTATGIYLYDTVTSSESRLEIPEENSFHRWVQLDALDYRPDGKLLAFGKRNIHFWNFSEDKYEPDLINQFPDSEIIEIEFSPEGNYLMVKSRGGFDTINCEDTEDNLALYDLKNGELLFDVAFCWRAGAQFYFTENDTLYVFVTADIGSSLGLLPYKVLKLQTSTGNLLDEIQYPYDSPDVERIYGVSADENTSVFLSITADSFSSKLVNSRSSSTTSLENKRVFYTPNRNRVWVLTGSWVDLLSGQGTYELQDRDGNRLCSFQGQRVPYSMHFSSDGNKMVVASDRYQIELWSIPTCSRLSVLAFPTPSNELVFSPDGTYLAAADSWTIYLWDMVSKEYKHTIPVFHLLGNELPFDFSSDSTSLITIRQDEKHDYSFVQIDLATGQDRDVFGVSDLFTKSIKYLPGDNFAAVSIGQGEIWNWKRKSLVSQFRGQPISVSYSPDKSYMAVLLQEPINNVVIIDAATGTRLGERHVSDAVSVNFLTNRELMIVSHREETDMWSFLTTDLMGNILRTLGDESQNCGFSEFIVTSYYLLNTCRNHQIQITDLETNAIKKLIGHHKDKQPDFQFTKVIASPTENLVASMSSMQDYSARKIWSEIRIWNVLNGALLYEMETDNKIKDLEFSPDGRFLAYLSEDGTIHILGIESDVKTE